MDNKVEIRSGTKIVFESLFLPVDSSRKLAPSFLSKAMAEN